MIIKILKESPIKKKPLKMRRGIRDLKAVSIRKELDLKVTRDNQFKYFFKEDNVTPGREAWEDEYCKKGILWSGLTHELPELPAGSCVLELGCGNGKTLPALIRKGWNVTALDSSQKAVAMSRDLLTGSLPAEIMVADARHIPVKNATFSAIFAIHVIGHMHEPDRQEIAVEVTRTLKPGGIVFFCEFSTEDVRFGKGHAIEPSTFMRGTKIITHYFTLQETSDLFPGLVCKSITLHQWPMRIRGNNLVRSEVIAVFSQ